LDAKINFDDNALFKHKNISDMRDWSQEDPREVQASKFDLNYIGLDGNIACMGIVQFNLCLLLAEIFTFY